MRGEGRNEERERGKKGERETRREKDSPGTSK